MECQNNVESGSLFDPLDIDELSSLMTMILEDDVVKLTLANEAEVISSSFELDELAGNQEM